MDYPNLQLFWHFIPKGSNNVEKTYIINYVKANDSSMRGGTFDEK